MADKHKRVCKWNLKEFMINVDGHLEEVTLEVTCLKFQNL
jgi:hypothetical protein